MTEVNITYTTDSAEATEKLGAHIGANLQGGEVIELVSDLGGGKTTLARGIVAGTGSKDRVSSPTFTVSKEYTVPGKVNRTLASIVHTDLYRLGELGLMEHEIADGIGDPSVTLIIEWADAVQHVLPDERLTITLQSQDELSRRIGIACPDSLSYLIEGIE